MQQEISLTVMHRVTSLTGWL